MRPFVEVYISKIPFEVDEGGVFSDERQTEIDSTENPRVKEQKFYVWKLLERALAEAAGIDVKATRFTRVNGKWSCKGWFFSLSHCGNVAVVAVSNAAVGVDLELVNPNRFDDKLARRICSERELDELNALNKRERALKLNQMWTVKEAAFKCGGYATFVPSQIEAPKSDYTSRQVLCDSKAYYMSVASKYVEFVAYHCSGVKL